MALAPTASVGVGVAMMGVVYAIYDQTVPPVIDERVQAAGDRDLAAAEKTARWVSAALVTAVGLITYDATVFILGASAVIGFSWVHRHANVVEPNIGSATVPSSRQLVHQDGMATAGTTPGL